LTLFRVILVKSTVKTISLNIKPLNCLVFNIPTERLPILYTYYTLLLIWYLVKSKMCRKLNIPSRSNGTSNAMVADLVSDAVRGTAYSTYNAILGFLTFPASLIARILLAGCGGLEWFWGICTIPVGAVMAFCASLLMIFWMPHSTLSVSAH